MENSEARNDESAPDLMQQTRELGKTLKLLADREPNATPGETARAVFFAWVQEAGPRSREPGYFQDVFENFDVTQNTNKDLWEIFDILSEHLLTGDEDEESSRGAFIPLPLAGA